MSTRLRAPRSALLVLLVAAVTALVFTTVGGAQEPGPPDHLHGTHPTSGPDAPIGFSAQVLAPHAAFADDVAATFRFKYADGGGTTVAQLRDASTVVMAEVTWEPGGTSGWHTHPGPVIVNIVEGALELTNASDCVTRTYTAGQAFVDQGQGNVHVAVNPSATEQTRVVATFFGVPAGGAPTEFAPPASC
jgi:quercetin dioxygenase-like cupin family protein